MEPTPIAVQLGEFAARLRFEDLPAAVVDKAKALVNHAVTVGLVGAGHARSAAARRAVLEHERLGPRRIGAGQGATLWIDGVRVTRAGAAFANGVAVAVNNQCDSYHMLTHPGVLIVPAGLATAEGEGRSGRELLTALVAGYAVIALSALPMKLNLIVAGTIGIVADTVADFARERWTRR